MVGAAIVRDGRVLAARRTTPAAAEGRWELPGGKVEEGESADDALVREIREELGLAARVVCWLDGESPIGEQHVLRVAVMAYDDGEASPTEHDRLRWLGAGELDDIDWLEPDRPFLVELSTLLAGVRG